MVQIQKLVVVHPTLFTQSRKRQLHHTGHPTFTFSRKSRSLGHDLNLQLPSDSHGFLETFDDRGKLFRISYFLIGSSELPKPDFFAQYAESVKQITFGGHICSIRSAFEIVSNLKACKSVQFYLGELEQLSLLNEKHSDEDSLKEDEIEPIDRIKSLHIRLSLTHVNDNKQLRKVIDNQVAQVVKGSVKFFPKLEIIKTDLPGEGQYFDLINKNLGLWKDLQDDCKAEISAADQKVRVAIRAKVEAPGSASGLITLQSPQNTFRSDKPPSPPVKTSEGLRAPLPKKQPKAQPFASPKIYKPESPTEDSGSENYNKRQKIHTHFTKYNQVSSNSFQTIAGTIHNELYPEQTRHTQEPYGHWGSPDSTNSGTTHSQKSQTLNQCVEIDLTQPNRRIVIAEANSISPSKDMASVISQAPAKVDLCVRERDGGKDEEVELLKTEVFKLQGVLAVYRKTVNQVKAIARKYKAQWEEANATANRQEEELRSQHCPQCKVDIGSGENEEFSNCPQSGWKGDVEELLNGLVKQHLFRCQKSEKVDTKIIQGDKFSELFDRR